MNMFNLEECELLADSKYKAYVNQVEKALKAFEYTSEWADLISALGKLNKVPYSSYISIRSTINLSIRSTINLIEWPN